MSTPKLRLEGTLGASQRDVTGVTTQALCKAASEVGNAFQEIALGRSSRRVAVYHR